MKLRHIGEFFVMIIAASFHTQSEGELMKIICLKKDKLFE